MKKLFIRLVLAFCLAFTTITILGSFTKVESKRVLNMLTPHYTLNEIQHKGHTFIVVSGEYGVAITEMK